MGQTALAAGMIAVGGVASLASQPRKTSPISALSSSLRRLSMR